MRMTRIVVALVRASRNVPDEEVIVLARGSRLGPRSATTAPRTGSEVAASRTVPPTSCELATCPKIRKAKSHAVAWNQRVRRSMLRLQVSGAPLY